MEQTGWLLSGALHVGVAVAALVGLPKLARQMPEPPPPIAIEFVQIAEQTRVVAPEAPADEPQEAQSKPQPNYAAAEAAPAVEEDAAPLLEKAKPVEVTPEPKPQPKPQVSENRQLANRVTPRAKPRAPSRLKSNRIAALIDRSIKEEQQDAQRRDEEEQKAAEKEPEAPKVNAFPAARLAIATASIRDALSNKVSGCWSFPLGSKGIEDMQVAVLISLRPDGSLLRRPQIVGGGDLSDGFYRVFAESAQRAVQRCAPYSEVAKQLFELGENSIRFTFNPKNFAGG